MKKFLLLAGLVCSLSAMAQVKNGYPGQKTRMLFLLDGKVRVGFKAGAKYETSSVNLEHGK